MYLSKIALNPSIAQKSQLGLILKDRSYGMHRLLWDLFEQGERFLFREESQREQLSAPRNLPLYYVLSKSEPKHDSLIFTIESKQFQPCLSDGDQLAFRLRANPTVSKPLEGKKNSVRHDVVMNAQSEWLKKANESRGLSIDGKKGELKKRLLTHQDSVDTKGMKYLDEALKNEMDNAAKHWLSSRGENMGFVLSGKSLQASSYRWNALPEKGRHAGFSSMDYEGILTVSDPDRFIEQLYTGFGPAKAFGCGLMLIRRV